MSYQITTDLQTIKRDMAYNILRVVFEKNNYLNMDVANRAKDLTKVMFNIDLEQSENTLKSKLLSTLLYDDNNKDKINNIYKEVAEDIANKLNLIFIVNPEISKMKELWGEDRKNYFVFSDLHLGSASPESASQPITIDTMPKVETVSVSGVPHMVLRKNNFVSALENSDVAVIRDIDIVEKNVAIALISSMQTNSGFTSTFKALLALPLKEDSVLKTYMGRDMIFASENKYPTLENNEEAKAIGLSDKIKDFRNQNFNISLESTNTNKPT